MQMIPVNSSNLRAVGYNPATQELTIEFYSGVYTYSGVPQQIFDGLLSASSKGSYHHQHIKQYPYRRGF